jgi:voltage-gated potassium channel
MGAARYGYTIQGELSAGIRPDRDAEGISSAVLSNPQTPRKRQPLRSLLWTRSPRPGYAALVIVVFWLGMAVVFGWFEHLVDGKAFPSTGLGVWWAVQTVTTVGYGDVVPGQTSGRVVAGILMLGGLSLLSVLTAAVTSVFVTRAQAEIRNQGVDPLMQQLDELTSAGGEIASLKAEINHLRADLSRRNNEALKATSGSAISINQGGGQQPSEGR